MTDTNEKRDRALEAIAFEQLGIRTLATRNSDQLDFHEVAVWRLKTALAKAYAAGREHAAADRDANTVPPSGVCPRCGEDDIDQLVWDDAGESVTCQRCGTNYTVIPLD